ncbi:MAG: hydrogenase maturation nickel metallochaperone HypA [Blastocatellia bacterium]
MHELAIMQGVLDIVSTEASKHGTAQANKIKLRIGAFTGVVKDALEFAFTAIKPGTVAERAMLEIEEVPLRKRCSQCEQIFQTRNDFNFLCPVCQHPLEILSGREMQVEYIDFV